MKNLFKYFPIVFLLAIVVAGCDDDEGNTINENPPTADFTANKTKIFQGESVTFTDLSANDPTTWMWNFGSIDDTTSTKSPSKTFPKVGTFSISLTVTNSFGADSITITNYIEVDTLIMGTPGTLTDIDGNTYNTITIGSQEWMTENLRVTHFFDGTEIPLIENDSIWGALEDNNDATAFCFPNNDSNSEYGALYTYGAAIKACPEGWHLPSDQEWKQLEMYIGMTQDEAEKSGWRGIDEGLKLKSFAGWDRNNGTIDFGFTALPAGYRYSSNGAFYPEGTSAYFWSSSEGDAGNANYRFLSYNSNQINSDNVRGKSYGFSVRCIKD